MEQHEQADSAPQIESNAVRTGYIVTEQLSRADKGGLTPPYYMQSGLTKGGQQ